jgi:hypothetical protein
MQFARRKFVNEDKEQVQKPSQKPHCHTIIKNIKYYYNTKGLSKPTLC